MPLDKFVLVLIIVIAAAGLTVALGVFVAASVQIPGIGLALLIPVLLGAYVLWRVIADRVTSDDDKRYDRIDR